MSRLNLTGDFRRALDPVELALDVGLVPDAWQEKALRSNAQRQLWLCSRQSGKSTVAALKATHSILYQGGLVLLASPSHDQSMELFRKAVDTLHQLPCIPEIVNESQRRLELANGGRIVSLSGNETTSRGFSAAKLIIIDEAAQVPDTVIAAIRPTLATTKGKMIALTTPFGRRGWFFEMWESGAVDVERFKITADQCPRIDPVWLENEKRIQGPWSFRQEFFCEFLEAQDAMFDSTIVERALSLEIAPLW